MKLSEDFYSNFDLADIQFCVGIAVSNAGYDYYATQIIEYRTNKFYGIKEGVTNRDYLQRQMRAERDAIRQEIDIMATEESTSWDYAAIKWFFIKRFLKVTRINATHRSNEVTSLAIEMGANRLQSIYEDVMRMLCTTKSNALITLYIPTTLFKKPFKTAINKAIREKIPNYSVIPTLTERDYDILREDFGKIYLQGLSVASQAFFPETGDPNSALCGNPIQLWYVHNPKAEFQSVLFGRGQDIKIGDDSVSRLNLKDTEEDLNTNSIDFVDVCTKIYQASSVLFEHTGYLVYDIYSYHCDRIVTSKIEEFRKTCERVYPGIQISTTTLSLGDCINDTHRGKIIDRLKYAKYLDDRFSHSVTATDLKAICETLYDITRTVKMEDGRRLFEVDGHRVYQVTNESQRFEALLNGYRALYELIDYINRNESRTGVSIHDFPVTIFRDSAYLNRFRTFDEYLVGHDIVKKLLDDIKYSENVDRRMNKLNGFYNNETIGDIFNANTSIKYITEFSILGNKHVSFLSEIAHRKRSISLDAELASKIYESSLDLISSNIFYSSYPFVKSASAEQPAMYMDMMPYEACMELIKHMAVVNKEILEQQERTEERFYDKVHFAYAIQFLYLLTRVQDFEGFPVSDPEGYFQLSLADMQRGIAGQMKKYASSDSPESAEIVKQLKYTLVYRLVNLVMCYNLFFDKALNLSDAQTLTSEDIHSIFYAYSIIKAYVDSAYNLRYRLVQMTMNERGEAAKTLLANSMFSIATSLVDQLDLLAIPSRITSMLDIGSLCNQDIVIYMDRGLLEGSKEASARLKKRNEMLIIAFNRMLGAFSDSVDLFLTLNTGIKAKLGAASRDGAFYSSILAPMEKLNREILCNNFLDSDEYYLISQKLTAGYTQFNQYGFALRDGMPLFRDFGVYRRFYHRRGVACNVYEDMSHIEQVPLDEEDIAFITG